jgi:hypothetical protein
LSASHRPSARFDWPTGCPTAVAVFRRMTNHDQKSRNAPRRP